MFLKVLFKHTFKLRSRWFGDCSRGARAALAEQPQRRQQSLALRVRGAVVPHEDRQQRPLPRRRAAGHVPAAAARDPRGPERGRHPHRDVRRPRVRRGAAARLAEGAPGAPAGAERPARPRRPASGRGHAKALQRLLVAVAPRVDCRSSCASWTRHPSREPELAAPPELRRSRPGAAGA